MRLSEQGKDYLVAKIGAETTSLLRMVLSDKALQRELSDLGLKIIREKHTCGHRVRDLMDPFSKFERNVLTAETPPRHLAVRHDLSRYQHIANR